MDIVIAELMDDAAVAALKKDFDVLYDPKLYLDTPRLEQALEHARALIVRNATQVTDALLAAGKHLKVAARLGVGLDNFDLDACKARGVEVVKADGANEDSVAEYVMAGLFVAFRGAFLSTDEMKRGEWPRPRLMAIGREIAGKTLGIVGFGGIGQQVARRAQALGMDVIAHNAFVASDDPVWARTNVRPVSLDELLVQSDAVTVHVPLNDSTRNLISAEKIALLKRYAVLVNSARGGVIDDAAVVQALKDGKLGAAVIDVFDPEPLGAGSVYADAPNVILTPHIAGTTQESNARVSSVVAKQVAARLSA